MTVRRLKTREQYLAVMAYRPLNKTAHFAMHQTDAAGAAGIGGADNIWMGAMVPKRWAKRAVTRNLIKRQIYSAASRAHGNLPRVAYVVRLRAGFSLNKFKSAASAQLRQEVKGELESLFQEAIEHSARGRAC